MLSRTQWRNGPTALRKLAAVMLALAMVLVASGSPASAAPRGFIEDQLGVGYFYGTFNESPNVALLAGGTAEQFCEAFPNDPGMAPMRVFMRNDGSVDLKVNDKNQPIYLYYIDFDDVPPWLDQVCETYFDVGSAPEPFASGTADLKVRISLLSDNLVDVFNSVNGKATGTDDTEYKVRASADLLVENGVPVGNPEDFVSFDLKEIRRR